MRWGTPKEWLTALLIYAGISGFFGFLTALFGSGGSFAERWQHGFVGCSLGLTIVLGPWIIWCVLTGILLRDHPDLIGRWIAIGAAVTFGGLLLLFGNWH